MSPLSHIKYMLFGGAGLFAVALLFGAPLQSALSLGILLACPLMMIFMMRSHGEGHNHRQSDPKDSENLPPEDHSTDAHRM